MKKYILGNIESIDDTKNQIQLEHLTLGAGSPNTYTFEVPSFLAAGARVRTRKCQLIEKLTQFCRLLKFSLIIWSA